MNFLRYNTVIFLISMVSICYGMVPMTPLMDAVWEGNINAAKNLLAKGVDPNEQNVIGNTALHYAMQLGRSTFITLFIEQPGIKVNIQNNKGQTPLMESFQSSRDKNRWKDLQKLVDKGADIHLADNMGWTALDWAAHLGWAEDITVFLKAGADPIVKNKKGDIPLTVLLLSPTMHSTIRARERRAIPVGKVLLKPTLLKGYFAPQLLLKINDWLPLLSFLSNSSFDQTLFLLLTNFEEFKTRIIEHPETVNDYDEFGATLLMYAAVLGYVDRVKFLLEQGASPLIQANDGKTIQETIETIFKKVSPEQQARYQEILKMLRRSYVSFLAILEKTKLPDLPLDIRKLVLYPYVKAGYKPTVETLDVLKQAAAFKKYRIIRSLSKPQEGLPALHADVIKKYIYPLAVGRKPAAPPAQPPVGGPGAPVPPAAGPTPLFNRKRVIQAAIAALSGYSLYRYLTHQEIPTNLDKEKLQTQLVAALANKQYEHAYQLAKYNPQAVHDLMADTAAVQDLKELIKQAELAIINETVEKSNWYFGPSASAQLTSLANLLKIIEKS